MSEHIHQASNNAAGTMHNTLTTSDVNQTQRDTAQLSEEFATSISSRFIDHRPQAVAQRQIQELGNHSRQARQLKAYGHMMQNSPRAIQLGAIQAMMDKAPIHRPNTDEGLQTKSAGQGTAQLAQQANPEPKPNNTGLPNQLKAGIESLSGMSMDHVKVNYNSDKPAQLNAHAYAQGSEIHVAPGQEQHVPHEAWHVVQQAQGRVRPTMQMKQGVAVNDDVGLEAEADVMGARAMQMHAFVTTPAPSSNVRQLVFGDVAQLELAVQIFKQSDFENLIADVSIQGRPDGVLQGEEGSHTTAWVVSTEGVRNAVVGKSFQAAISGIKKLISIAYQMPGYKRAENQTYFKEEMFQGYEENLKIALSATESGSGILVLQDLIEAYLTFRNAIPLSAVKLGSTADGKGESKWIKVLYDWENKDKEILREAFLSLIDFDAILGFEKASSKYTDKDRTVFVDAPGVTAEDKDSDTVKKDVIYQHLLSVSGSFPQAYEKSGLDNKGFVWLLNRIEGYDTLHKRQKEEKTTVTYPLTNVAPSKPKTAVQIDMGPEFDYLSDFDTRKIVSMKIAGRPRGVFGSGEKSHATAWSIIEQGPKTVCIGKTLPEAYEAMKTLSESVFGLPQTEMTDALPAQQKEEFEAAWKLLSADTKSGNDTVNAMQQMIVNYLSLKNLMPFSAVDLGKKADSHGEPEKLRILRAYNSSSKEQLQEAIWGMLDREVMVDIGIGATTQTYLLRSKKEVYEKLLEEASEKQRLSGKRSSRRSQEFKDLPKYDDVEPEYIDIFEKPQETHKRLPGVPHPEEYAEGEDNMDKASRVGMVVGNHLKNVHISFPDAYEKAAIVEQDVKNYIGFLFLTDKFGYMAIASEAVKIVKNYL